MSAIFIFSSRNYEQTNSISKSVTKIAVSVIFSDFHEMNELTQSEIISGMNKFIRKIAHFTLFFLLGGFIFVTGYFYGKSLKKSAYTAFLICTLYAAADELHQVFVSGRNSQILDVVIDCTGAVIGIFFFFAVISAIERLKPS